MRCNARPGEARRNDNATVQCSAVQTVQYAAADAFASFFFRFPFFPPRVPCSQPLTESNTPDTHTCIR